MRCDRRNLDRRGGRVDNSHIVFRRPVVDVHNSRGASSVNHWRTFVPQPDHLIDDFRSKFHGVHSSTRRTPRVIPDISHRDRRVELDLKPDVKLELDDAALRVVSLRQDVFTAPQLDIEVFDAGDRDAEFCRVPDMRHVVGCSRKAARRFFRCWMVMRKHLRVLSLAGRSGFFRGLPLRPSCLSSQRPWRELHGEEVSSTPDWTLC